MEHRTLVESRFTSALAGPTATMLPPPMPPICTMGGIVVSFVATRNTALLLQYKMLTPLTGEFTLWAMPPQAVLSFSSSSYSWAGGSVDSGPGGSAASGPGPVYPAPTRCTGSKPQPKTKVWGSLVGALIQKHIGLGQGPAVSLILCFSF